MIVYNVTVKIEAAFAAAWVHWLRNEHGPEILATGCFYAFQLLHLVEMDDADGPTYAVQFRAHTPADFETYQVRFANQLQARAFQKWGNRALSFSTLMHVVG